MLAHQLALASDYIHADMIEANEFPDLSNRYEVYGVPRTVINEVIDIEGAVPEDEVVSQLMTVMDEAQMKALRQKWHNE